MKSSLPPVSGADLRQLKVFRAVVTSGGFTAAQTQLGLSRSTISNLMSELETRLGFALCLRGRGGFSLTQEGHRIYAQSEALFIALEKFRRESGEIRGQLIGDLRVGIVDNLADNPNCQLHSAIRQFVSKAPDVQLKLSVRSPSTITESLQKGEVDIAITTLSDLPAVIKHQVIFQEHAYLYCGQGHPAYDMTDTGLSLDWISKQPYAARDYMVTMPYDSLFSQPATATATQMEGLAHCVLSGKFLGVLPSHLAQHWVETGQMKRVRHDLISYRLSVRVAYTELSVASRVTSLFRDCLIAAHKV